MLVYQKVSFKTVFFFGDLKIVLGGGFKDLLFLPLGGEMIQFDEHIFQLGSNHHQTVQHFRFGMKNIGGLSVFPVDGVWKTYLCLSDEELRASR